MFERVWVICMGLPLSSYSQRTDCPLPAGLGFSQPLLLLSHVQLFVTLWIVVLQGSLSMGFSRQEYWSGLTFPPLGDLPDPGIKPVSLASPVLADRFFGTETPGKSLLFSQRWPICKDICGQGTFISGYVLPTI